MINNAMETFFLMLIIYNVRIKRNKRCDCYFCANIMNKAPVYILGIESSCDDTSAAVTCDDKVLSNVIAGQEIHRQYGGVVPELASRAHQQNIIPVVKAALDKANVRKEQLSAVAFTRGPGLIGSLLVGTSFAKSFALAAGIPLIEVNHMEAHVLANFASRPTVVSFTSPSFPFLCLTVSGGHTQIVKATSYSKLEVIGQTLDDAAGEAFDKSAKILGLPYPGGPLIDKFAKEGNPLAFPFPHPFAPDLNFSFSGLKTSILYFVEKNLHKDPQFVDKNKADICASIQHTIISVLMEKLKLAVHQTGIKSIAIAGGVSANSGLRKVVMELSDTLKCKVSIPDFEYCTDNAAMIAIAGYFKYLDGNFTDQETAPLARYPV
jgi:N6-L-threonylcarbamoyladenine synthase